MRKKAWRSAAATLLLAGFCGAAWAEGLFREIARDHDSVSYLAWIEPEDIQASFTPEGVLFRLEGATLFGAPGQPLLPRWVRTVEIPPGRDAVLHVRARSTRRVRSLPAPLTAYDDSGLPLLPAARSAAIRLGPISVRGGRRFAPLIIDPVRIRDDGAEVLTVARVQVRFPLSRGGSPAVAPGRLPGAAGAPGYLFLVDDSLLGAPSLDALATWRTQRGFNVAVEPVSTTGRDPFAIRELITQHYQRGGTHVLFVGDDPDVPVFPGGLDPSEHWYTTVDGYDLYSDVVLGRLPVHNEEELDAVVQRSLAWEKEGIAVGADRVSLVAHKAGYAGRFTALAERIATAEYRYPMEFSTLYGGAGATNEDVQDMLASAVQVLAYRGYGGPGDWQFWGADEKSFTNADVTPGATIVFNIACDNGWVDDPQGPSIAEAWMLEGGAVGVLGALRRSYDVPNNALEEYLFQAMFDEGIARAGSLVNRAREFLLDTQGEYGSHDARIYLWLGDPDLPLRHSPLQPVTAAVPPTLSLEGDPIALAVTSAGQPLVGAIVTVSRGRSLLNRAETDTAGVALVSIPQGTQPGPATLTITEAQTIPLERQLLLVESDEHRTTVHAVSAEDQVE
jgi:hypothetical protein